MGGVGSTCHGRSRGMEFEDGHPVVDRSLPPTHAPLGRTCRQTNGRSVEHSHVGLGAREGEARWRRWPGKVASQTQKEVGG
jgi:hypothetical protein